MVSYRLFRMLVLAWTLMSASLVAWAVGAPNPIEPGETGGHVTTPVSGIAEILEQSLKGNVSDAQGSPGN